jgi:aminobenzoyl-glutamate utilization protein B
MTANVDMAPVRAAWLGIRPEIEALFATLWKCPELPGLEYETAGHLIRFLERHGFAVERGSGGVPTAFVARRGTLGGTRIGILAEYDALAGLDNDAVPRRTGTGRKPGHGCGHNHIGPANSGAGIAAAIAAERLGLAGEIVVVGCPAEEIGWGKIALQRAGVFDGLDVILTSHGDYQNGALSRPCHAVMSGEFVFRGDSAHGGKTAARNALKAAEDALAAFETVRASRYPEANGKHVFRLAGVMPGVTPDEVRVWCSVRHIDYEAMHIVYRAMVEVFAATAGEMGVAFEEKFVSACRGYLANDTVGRLLDGCLSEVGPPRWSESDIAWMRELSAAASPDTPFDLHRDLAYFDEGIDYYGQDDGDASWVVPLGRVNWAYPTNVPIHHWAWTALSGHPSSSAGPLMASEALAVAAVRLMAAPDLVAAAKAELARRVAGASIVLPRPGIDEIMATDPAAFWEARW